MPRVPDETWYERHSDNMACHKTGVCDSPLFADAAAQAAAIATLPRAALWTVDEDQKHLRRAFTAKSFGAALAFLNAAGAIAEELGHHPDLHITSYREVAVVLWTHSAGGLTALDIGLAAKLDEIAVEYSPKWLKENPAAQ